MARTKASKASGSASSPTEPGSNSNENAKWTPEDEQAFIGFLTDHVSERGDGNYKMSTFNAAAAFLEKRRTAGGQKTGLTCKNKWARLKEIHGICYKLKNNQGTSGFTWSEERGADIGIEDEAVWDAYIKKNPKAAQFKHKGWPLYNAVDNIIPDKAKGKHLFAASQAPAADPSDDPQGGSGSEAGDEPDGSSDASEVSSGDSTQLTGRNGKNVSYTPPPPPPAPSLGRKRSALEMSETTSHSSMPSIPQRRPRETALSRSIDHMSEVIANMIAAPDPDAASMHPALESTPKRRRIAVEMVIQQEDDELSDNDMMELVEVMRRDIAAADTYVSLSKMGDRFRRAWVRHIVSHRYPS
ncbi:hypothetical protein DENSPDRAFT_830747 [Dentipellis sp. KUC8613]|nr:hypothetical protein DENSPDRAFT_830747 [Dentipellis sp. KUC8613]